MDVDPPSSGGNCAGVALEWPEDIPFHSTFPFHRLTLLGDDGDLPFDIEIRQRGKVVTAWSKKCRNTSTLFSAHCQECDGIRKRLNDLAEIARDAKKGTNYKFLGHSQLRDLIERNEELNRLKLEFNYLDSPLNLGRRIATCTRQLDDFERLLTAIAENDVPRIHSIIETAATSVSFSLSVTEESYKADQ
ncbi:hypothetical protein B0H14DRAFT_2410080 [Mycena olivaceomarginata]|nr:hypothetical protein B0H14DRAFT_2410080 [Mycena olivaceomarginata]